MTTRFTRSALAAILVLAVSQTSARAQPRAEPAAEPRARTTWTADNGNGTFSNPLFYDEFSDCDLIRVGQDFYLTGTTMHSMPGLPILHSRDLVNWRFLAYALDTLDLGPAFRLEDGKRVYGQGIWAPSFRFHKGTFHIFSNVNGQTTQLFRATNPAGPWTRTAMKRSFHDLSVLFDDDGKAYVVWGYRGIRLAELTPDLLDIVPGTEREIIAQDAGMGEGLHLYKIRGKYFLTSAWFLGEMRMPTARADRLTGPWEVNQEVSRGEDFGFAEGNRLEQRPAGSPPPPPFAVRAGNADAPGRNAIHQGGIVDTPAGEWWGFSMMDANSVGRLTALSPVTWSDGWPYFGMPKNLGRSPRTWVKPRTGTTTPPTAPYQRSDEFSAARLQPIWQWNHVPVAGKWSLTERKGHLRLHTLAAPDLLAARNTLTQRAIGPRSTPTVALDSSGLKPGDTAGLALFNRPYAWLGVSVDAEGPALTYVTEEAGRVERVPLTAGRVWLRAACDFLREEARFSYSTDGKVFQPIGDPFRLVFQLMTFQGVRYSLFAFGSGGGFADFDAIDVREPNPRGLTIPIPYGRAIELAAQGQAQGQAQGPPRRWQAGTGDTVQVGAGAGTRFTVVDRGLGRVALRTERGLVSVGADGTLSLHAGTPGDAETFQWIETFTGELTLLSLATQRYVRLDGDGGVLRADARGPHANRGDGVRWTWSGPADLPVPRTDNNSRLAHEQLLAKRTQG
ncbi:MAG: family 43 glycosylhydrolase, partial [Vicinamibacteria bacterium]